MKIYIMRGLPGSGKSTWVKNHIESTSHYNGHPTIISADDFHMVNGLYQYDPKNVSLAHQKCLRDYISCVKESYDLGYEVFVDNTNTTLVDMIPYIRIAEAFSHPVYITYLYVTPEESLARNTHKVPFETILKMYKNLLTEEIPSYWKQQIISPSYEPRPLYELDLFV